MKARKLEAVVEKATFHKTEAQRQAQKLLSWASLLYVLLYGGSRSGKTAIIVRTIIVRALKYPRSRHLMLRLHFSHAKTSLWHDTIPKIMRLCFPELKLGRDYAMNKQDWFIEFANGSQIWLGGLDDKERVEKILGTEYATIYFNECSQLSYSAVKMAFTRLAQVIEGCSKKFYFDCNPPNKRHWTYSLFVKKVDPDTGRPIAEELVNKYACMRMNPDSNRENLGSDYVDIVLASLGEREQKRFRDGEFVDDAEGALFSYQNLIRDRIPRDKFDKSVLTNIVIAVDPAVSDTEKSDAHGLMVVGYNKDTEDLYILEDASTTGSPKKWANIVDSLFYSYDSDMVVGEINNGGDLVEVNLRTVNKTLPYKSVRASKGKAMRAEPVSSMSERGKLHLVGEFPLLEEEMTSWVPDIGMKSPNRLDAMVWGCTYFIKGKKRAGSW